MTDADSKAVMRRFLAALGQGDPDTAAGLLAQDAVCHVPGMSAALRGREAWRHLFQMYIAAFPDMDITIHDEIAQGETAMARWSWNGTQTGALMDIPASGRAVSGISGMGVFRIRGECITEEWVIEDSLGLMQQLGVMPKEG